MRKRPGNAKETQIWMGLKNLQNSEESGTKLFPAIQSGCRCLGRCADSKAGVGGISRHLGCVGSGCYVFRAVLKGVERSVTDLGGFPSTIDMFVWFAPSLDIFFLGMLWLVYHITLFSSIPRRSPRINPRYAHLVVWVQLALVSAWEIE